MVKYLILLPLLFFAGMINSQNIFMGGSEDGFATGNFAQPDNPMLDIFSGGNEGGFANACFAQPDNPMLDIFSGGNDDGFANACFAQPDNPMLDIFSGGNNDGFANACFAQPDNPMLDIFSGGNNDGFANACFAQPDNPMLNIFSGGNNDGFANACFAQPNNPMLAIFSGGNNNGFGYNCIDDIALPIELLHFNAKINGKWVLLDWSTINERNNDYFTIEKSLHLLNWEEVFIINGNGQSSEFTNYNAIDKTPYKGTSYYRLKQTNFDETFAYTPIRMVKFTRNENQSIHLYPNPANTHITIEGSQKELAEFKIHNLLGQDVTAQTSTINNTPTTKLINLSRLTAGIYTIITKNRVEKFIKE